jgi:CRISPR-associated protein Csm3
MEGKRMIEEKRSQMQFLGNVIITYKLRTITGLHIGGSKDNFEIGGLDNPVIKVPSEVEFDSVFKGKTITVEEDQPYIPGSSIKGKLRSLLEWKYDDIDWNSGNGGSKESIEKLSKEKKNIRKLFGISPTGKEEELKKFIEERLFPVRIRIFDAYPLEEIETELKFENSINRITSKANPRNFERVPAGSEFEGKIVVRIFGEEDAELLNLLSEAFSLLEDDYLGGGGSRGSGRVKFEEVKIVFRDKEFYRNKREEEILAEGENFKEAFEKAVKKLEGILSKESSPDGK